MLIAKQLILSVNWNICLVHLNCITCVFLSFSYLIHYLQKMLWLYVYVRFYFTKQGISDDKSIVAETPTCYNLQMLCIELFLVFYDVEFVQSTFQLSVIRTSYIDY